MHLLPANAACQNNTTAGTYLSHPYGIAIHYTISPASLVVSDMSSFNGAGAIMRIQAVPSSPYPFHPMGSTPLVTLN